MVIQATGYSSEEFGEFCIGEVSSGLCIMDELDIKADDVSDLIL